MLCATHQLRFAVFVLEFLFLRETHSLNCITRMFTTPQGCLNVIIFSSCWMLFRSFLGMFDLFCDWYNKLMHWVPFSSNFVGFFYSFAYLYAIRLVNILFTVRLELGFDGGLLFVKGGTTLGLTELFNTRLEINENLLRIL